MQGELHGKSFLSALPKQGSDLWDEDDRELSEIKKCRLR